MATRKKRRHPRARAKGLSVLFGGQAGAMPCSVEDISLGGVFVRTTEQFLPGTEVAITLLRPGMRKGLKVLSTVANLRTAGPDRQAGVGVRFEGLSDDTRQKLVSLLGEFGVADPVEREEDAKDPAPPAPRRRASREVPQTSVVLGKPFIGNYEVEEDVDDFFDEPLVEDSGVLGQPTAVKGSFRDLDASAQGLMDQLQHQIRSLLIQLDAAEQRVSTHVAELAALRRRVVDLEGALSQRDVEIAQLRSRLKR